MTARVNHPVARRVHGEFKEMPGLKLNVGQAQRLFGLGSTECEALLRTLVNARYLAQTRDGSYILASAKP